MEHQPPAPCETHDIAPAVAGQEGADAVNRENTTVALSEIIKAYRRRKIEPCQIPKHIREDA